MMVGNGSRGVGVEKGKGVGILFFFKRPSKCYINGSEL